MIFEYRNLLLNINVTYKNIKNINIRINKFDELKVSAPLQANEDDIRSVLKKNYFYLIDYTNKAHQKNEMLKNLEFPIEWISGTRVSILKKKYRVLVKKSGKEGIELKHNDVIIYSKDDLYNSSNNKRIFKRWLSAYLNNNTTKFEKDYILHKLDKSKK